MRFDLPLQCLESELHVTKKWVPHFYSLRGRCLYHSDGKNGHPDTQNGTLAFMQSSPEPDGRHCVDLQGMIMHVTRHRVTLLHRLLCCRLQRASTWTGFRV